MCLLVWYFFEGYGDHRDLHVLTHSFPTRRSSDLEVERSDGGAATGCMNMFLNLLKPARGARGEDDMRAKPGQRLGGGGAYTPARACHKGESSVQRLEIGRAHV